MRSRFVFPRQSSKTGYVISWPSTTPLLQVTLRFVAASQSCVHTIGIVSMRGGKREMRGVKGYVRQNASLWSYIASMSRSRA